MATYYTNPSNQRDGAPMFYTRENMAGSYQENSVIPGNMMMYMNSGSFSDSLAGNSQQEQADREVLSVGGEDGSAPPQQEMLSVFEGSRLGEQDYNAWRDGRNEMLLMQSVGASSGMLGGQQNLHGQGLSLSLSTRIPSGIQIPAEYFPPSGFPGGNKGDLSDLSSPYAMSCAARNVPGSKYLKAAQQLLDEVVNVRRALKQPEDEKNNNKDEEMEKGSGEGERNEAFPSGVASNPQESSSGAPSELSHAERQDLQNKLTKLLSMLDEVDRRYKQYYHQMQIVVSSFDAIAGCGAAKPYTALALQTISRHFRCLRDAITGQIRAARKSLGEQDSSLNGKGVGISRLRFVDQQLRQQRALQQLGMMQQHAWRPQRGLPESSVSVLRAWLFEHFLHPYPKDSDKIMLARQTGLTRSQVSNWFINARVRLWKPMVEEMYKEEAGDAEIESNSSSENNAGRGSKGDETRNSDDRGQDIRSTEMAGSASFHNRSDMGIDDCNLYPDRSFMAAAYQIPTGMGSGVSLTLGLQHCDGASLNLPHMPGGSQNSFVPMSGDSVYNAGASSSEAADFECNIDAGNRQHRFNSSQLLHDFVA